MAWKLFSDLRTFNLISHIVELLICKHYRVIIESFDDFLPHLTLLYLGLKIRYTVLYWKLTAVVCTLKLSVINFCQTFFVPENSCDKKWTFCNFWVSASFRNKTFRYLTLFTYPLFLFFLLSCIEEKVFISQKLIKYCRDKVPFPDHHVRFCSCEFYFYSVPK